MSRPPTQPRASTPTIPTPVRVEVSARSILLLLGVLVALWLVVRLTPVLLVIVVSLMLVGSLNPLVESLQARGLTRGRAIGVIFTLLLVVVLVLVTLTIPDLIAQASELVEREPALREQLAQYLARRRLTASLAVSLRQVNYAALLGSSATFAFAASVRVAEVVAYGVGSIFLALYVMLDRDRLRGSLFAITPRAHHITLSRVLLNLEKIVGGYIRGQVITCVAMAVFMFVLLSIVGVKSALALAVLAGIADVLPYIGGLVALVPAVLVTLPQGLVVVGSVTAAVLIYQEIESRLLIPLVYGRALRLPSSVVLVALLAGGTLGGIAGAMLALPLASALLMLIDELRVDLPGDAASSEKVQQQSDDGVDERVYVERTAGMPAAEAAAIAVAMVRERDKSDSDEELRKSALLEDAQAEVLDASVDPASVGDVR
jgi:putative heme transporter